MLVLELKRRHPFFKKLSTGSSRLIINFIESVFKETILIRIEPPKFY